ncbi:Na+/H+ antiporter [Mycolicibacterium sp. 018/SC-01/001]|uniref:Na+/H+ antiporter n=1 Tax=Mycolicibacterium sp. 018/SC-01/001 TaxID=2592069 RepID=UPI00117C1633|nr:Na+/H+ antiporter [Mycolicibacterium sp. 018/SC-01/001]TRW81449.1 Na+/H+ antiporter [Mycolicibacterium sp. 018/SC-01/001]
MDHAEVLITALLMAVAALGALACRLSVPYPIPLVVGGALAGFIPGLPDISLEPDLVLALFLPPLLYKSAIYANFGDFRTGLRSLTLSAVALVVVTMGAVAFAAHAVIPGMPWEAAFVLGAIVSPTDPVAAATIMRRLGAPRRLISSVEGEGLFNDATALVAFRVAVAATVAGGFSLADAGLRFLFGALGGIAIGLVVGWLSAWVRARIYDAQISVTISLLTGYAAFLPAEAAGASAVLAVVTAGIVMAIRSPEVLEARPRLQGYFVWDIVDFLINATLFALIGLQLRAIVAGLHEYRLPALVGYAAAVLAAVVASRFVWFFSVPYLIRVLDRRPQQRRRRAPASWRIVLAWSGMRGAVSLAVALAVPAQTADGAPFPHRELILFLTFVVIFFTLVVQGLTLPVLIGRLDRTADPETTEEDRARLAAARAAIERIDELADEGWTRTDTAERMRGLYEYRTQRFEARLAGDEIGQYEERSRMYQDMVRAVLAAQRRELLSMRRQGELSNEAFNRILRDIDLEESRLET